MAVLHIFLEEGFKEDTVVVRVGDREVFEKADVTEDYRISLADSFDANVPEGQVRVEASLPDRELVKGIDLQVTTEAYVGFSIVDGELTARKRDDAAQEEIFGYL